MNTLQKLFARFVPVGPKFAAILEANYMHHVETVAFADALLGILRATKQEKYRDNAVVEVTVTFAACMDGSPKVVEVLLEDPANRHHRRQLTDSKLCAELTEKLADEMRGRLG